MGVNHLEELRNFLRENDEAFSRGKLRNILNHNKDTIEENLNYLLNIEKVIEEIDGPIIKFRWKK